MCFLLDLATRKAPAARISKPNDRATATALGPVSGNSPSAVEVPSAGTAAGTLTLCIAFGEALEVLLANVLPEALELSASVGSGDSISPLRSVATNSPQAIHLSSQELTPVTRMKRAAEPSSSTV